MTPPRTTPERTAKAETARQARLQREAEALRANLHRRKAQARATLPRAQNGEGDAGRKPR